MPLHILINFNPFELHMFSGQIFVLCELSNVTFVLFLLKWKYLKVQRSEAKVYFFSDKVKAQE